MCVSSRTLDNFDMSEKRIASHFPVLDRLGLGLVRAYDVQVYVYCKFLQAHWDKNR